MWILSLRHGAQLLHSMWNVSSLIKDPTHVPSILTTGPPGKSLVRHCFNPQRGDVTCPGSHSNWGWNQSPVARGCAFTCVSSELSREVHSRQGQVSEDLQVLLNGMMKMFWNDTVGGCRALDPLWFQSRSSTSRSKPFLYALFFFQFSWDIIVIQHSIDWRCTQNGWIYMHLEMVTEIQH